MATELDRLLELDRKLQFVGKGADVAERERFCSAFTEEAARLLHGDGWRRIRKTEGKQVDGKDIDKLVHATSHELRDIIVNAGIAAAAVAWNHVGFLDDESRFIEVRPVPVPEPQQPPAPPGPPPDVPLPDDFMEVLRDLVNGRDETNLQLSRIADILGAIDSHMAFIRQRIFG